MTETIPVQRTGASPFGDCGQCGRQAPRHWHMNEKTRQLELWCMICCRTLIMTHRMEQWKKEHPFEGVISTGTRIEEEEEEERNLTDRPSQSGFDRRRS